MFRLLLDHEDLRQGIAKKGHLLMLPCSFEVFEIQLSDRSNASKDADCITLAG